MKSLQVKALVASLMVLVLVIYPQAAFANAIPIRHGSDVGVTSNNVDWNLYGPSLVVPDGAVTTKQEVICSEGDVASAFGDTTNSGGCSSGNYIFLFQFTSTKTNLVFTLTNLQGFTFDVNASNPSESTVGVIQCDSENTTILCTTLAASGAASSFPAITFTAPKTNVSVSFHVPSVPAYPAGTGTQGQGLTVYVQTHLTTPVPLAIPKPN
jgi:hypothetical protein